MYHYTEEGSLFPTHWYLTSTVITEIGTLLITPCYLTCAVITVVHTLLTTVCYLTCTMITEVGTLLTKPCYLNNVYHENRNRHSAHHTLLYKGPSTQDDFVLHDLLCTMNWAHLVEVEMV